MTENEFRETAWFAKLSDPVGPSGWRSFRNQENIEQLLNHDPDSFFEPVYDSPYEDWCVVDHDESEKLKRDKKKEIEDFYSSVYTKLYSIAPIPEFCALVYDEVVAIASLLEMKGDDVSLFIKDKISIYKEGHIPWGYEGNHPKGIWIVI